MIFPIFARRKTAREAERLQRELKQQADYIVRLSEAAEPFELFPNVNGRKLAEVLAERKPGVVKDEGGAVDA